MTNPKRASMREGPLAALFRKTEGEEPAGADSAPESAAADAAPRGRRPPPRAMSAARPIRR